MKPIAYGKYELHLEEASYICIVILSIVYGDHISNNLFIPFTSIFVFLGVYLGVFALSIQALSTNPNMSKIKKRFYMIFSGVTLVFNTITAFSQTDLGGEALIVHRNYPGGPAMYHFHSGTLWYQIFGTISYSLGIALTDALYIYRFYMIVGSRKGVAALIPFYLAFLCLAVWDVYWQLVKPFEAYICTVLMAISTTVLNILITVLICFRLKTMRREVVSHKSASLISGIAAILVESMAPITIVGAVASIVGALGCPVGFPLQLLWFAVLLSPQLITLRVASGSAWSRDTIIVVTATGIEFDINERIDPTSEVGAGIHSA